jgi:hypothetical protein
VAKKNIFRLETMKNRLIIAFVLISSVISFAGAEISSFSARSSNGSIIVNWHSNNENNVRQYVVERQTVNGSFVEVGNVDPRSDRNYEFIDQTAFKSSGVLYIYRIKIIDVDGSVATTWTVTVAHNVSSVKRTWGSIKALFR